MVAIFIGALALLLGFAVLVLPLLVTELSRPRDSLWGAVTLFLGLVLVTTHDRLTGAPILAVVSGFLLTSRLGCEVSLSRWNQLSHEEKIRLSSAERWTSGIKQIGAIILQPIGVLGSLIKLVFSTPKTNSIKKKWVRPENKSSEQQSPNQSVNKSDEGLPSSNEQVKQQPQETLEGQSASKDS